tara:strand:- start:12257 stop:12970 length:714 start_codon:yes stop_codon:yes gene_type:complete
MQAVIIGAGGGIGAALVAQCAADPAIEKLHIVSRRPAGSRGKISSWSADITNETSLVDLADALKRETDLRLILVATGILSNGDKLQPEKSLRHQSADAFDQLFRINTFGPALVAKHLLPIMPRRGRAVFAALTARVGSIGDNRLGGWHAYRASKAALNMLIRNYGIEQARLNPDFIVAGLHPGTVDTSLSRPFQKNVPDQQLFSPTESAKHLLRVIDGLTPADSGKCFDWAGKEIPA